MPVARPIANTNAIEATAFVLVFSREFEEKEVEALLSLEHSLKSELSSFTKTSSLTLNVVDNAPAEHTQQLSGVLLQSFQDSGKPDWTLRASDNMIVISCLKYDSWESVWPKACQLMLKAAQCVESDRISIAHAAFQVVDKFVYDEKPMPYSVEDVFNPDSVFLTQQVKSSGDLWHIFQGWFERASNQVANEDDILHTLKLGSAINNEKLIALIDHTLQRNFKGRVVNVKDLLGLEVPEKGSIFTNQLFKDLHDGNVKVLKNLLAVDQQIAIGLTK
jgi:hypothetical protein